MENEPDIAALAEKLLNLWQDYLSSLAADPDFAQEVTQFLSLWNRQSQGAVSPYALPQTLFTFPPGPQAPSFTSATGAASMEQFGNYLAAIEKRLAGIEKKLSRRTSSSRRRNKTKASQ